MAHPNSVLIVSYQAELLAGHAEALASAGFTTTKVNTMSAALGAVGPGQYKVMILAHTIPTGDRRRVEGEAKRRNPNIKIVLMYEGQQDRDVFASAFVEINDPPSAMVETVRALLTPEKGS